MGEEGLAGAGQGDAAGGAAKQSRAHGALQNADLFRERWLGDAEVFGSAGEVSRVGDFHEVRKLLELHPTIIDVVYESGPNLDLARIKKWS